MTLEIRHDVPLAPLTTLELGGAAEHFAEVRTDAEFVEACNWAADADHALTLLGGGSNVIVPDAGVRGLVVRVVSRGLAFRGPEVRVAAGEPWDGVVAACVGRGLGGIECLSGIPGFTGATPIQNVGAYGQDVSQVMVAVEALDLRTLQTETFDAAACGFSYRDSRFKRFSGEYAVLQVTLRLAQDGAPTIRYGELERALQGQQSPTLQQVRDTVLRLRSHKSMVIDPADPNRRSAGSFFLNPVVSQEVADKIVQDCVRAGLAKTPADVPRYASADGVKLAAGWLIEKSGTHKGFRRGAVGVSSNHALALVHHGGGTTSELLALADEVAQRVHDHFGVTLQREPRML